MRKVHFHWITAATAVAALLGAAAVAIPAYDTPLPAIAARAAHPLTLEGERA